MATSRHCGRSWAWAITNERSGPNQGPKRKPRTRQRFFNSPGLIRYWHTGRSDDVLHIASGFGKT